MGYLGGGTIEEKVNYLNNRGYNYRSNVQVPNQYHPGIRNHENFSYSNTRNVLNPPPGISMPSQEKKPSLEELLSEYIAKSEAKQDRADLRIDSLEASMKNMELQIWQLASAISAQQRGFFPSNIEMNPKEQCMAIKLRSGKEVESDSPLPIPSSSSIPSLPSTPMQEVQEEKSLNNGKEVVIETEKVANKNNYVPGRITFSNNPPTLKPPLPFPQRFAKKKLDDQFAKFLDIFKKININIPFTDALEEMPNYTRFLKEVMMKKRKLEEFETVKLTEECRAIIQKKLPQKLKDSGSFTIPCVIGSSSFDNVLCDLGASIYLMPLYIFRKLGLGEVKPTTISLQLANRSITYPWGIIEDILVKVDKFIFPVDFVVLDIEEEGDVPLILGRPFLATR